MYLLFHLLKPEKTCTSLGVKRACLMPSKPREEGLSIRKAAMRYNIPKSTLRDRFNGKVLPGTISGPPALLTQKAENDLQCVFLLWLSGIVRL